MPSRGARSNAGYSPNLAAGLNLESLRVTPAQRLPAAPGPVEKVLFPQNPSRFYPRVPYEPARALARAPARNGLFQQARPLKWWAWWAKEAG